ncbi:phosphotriesterase-related protein [Blastococcus colisei]|uniref:Phosphotriesterase-related protein n=1 Tax=Blastococcus colisei TaxID=1564162 RepID=A0A543PDW4_9ACTN|nr:phosphotriesterase-related protein [Blastococcus colisei]TQN42239.1 phosphotriesterase-related protein [Blastococcus colisei]
MTDRTTAPDRGGRDGGRPGGVVQTFRGPVSPAALGRTLIHEHVFVGSTELDVNHPHPEWDESAAIARAARQLTELYRLGVRTVVDLTVLGLGRDVARVARVAQQVPVHLVASTGYYTSNVLPPFFGTHGPGRLVGGPDPLVEFFVGDIEVGIAGSGVRAGMLKVVTDAEGITEDVARVMTAAAVAHQQTGVPITTHSRPDLRNGLDQQAFLRAAGVDLSRVVIGHCGDSEDIPYLRGLMDAGSTIGMDRFGMEHVLPDERRVAVVLELLRLGYADRMVLSHDAASFSRVTPPSWRAVHAPNWNFGNIPRRIVPMLLEGGASPEDVDRMMIDNPARLLGSAR